MSANVGLAILMIVVIGAALPMLFTAAPMKKDNTDNRS